MAEPNPEFWGAVVALVAAAVIALAVDTKDRGNFGWIPSWLTGALTVMAVIALIELARKSPAPPLSAVVIIGGGLAVAVSITLISGEHRDRY